MFWYTKMYSLLVNWCCHALWRVLSNNVIWGPGHCWVDIPHIYTSDWDSLFFQSCLLSTVTGSSSDSDYVSRSASLQRFRWIHTTWSQQSRVRFFTLKECGVSKKRVIIMDNGEDKNAPSTPAETSGPSTQDHDCARGPEAGAQKRCGNGEE